MSGIILFHCSLSWFMMQLMLINFVASGSLIINSTLIKNESKQFLDRSRRSIETMPRTLNLRIKYPTGEEIELKLIKQIQHLANRHLPVMTPSDYPHKNVMKKTGKFLLYQDLNTCSAFVYFEKTQTLAGVIGLDYTVWKSPFVLDNDGNYLEIITTPYLNKYPTKRGHNQPFASPVNSFADNQRESVGQSLNSEPGPSKRQRTERDIGDEIHEQITNWNATEVHNIRKRHWAPITQDYYIEILIFISRDIAELVKSWYGLEDYVDILIRDQTTYFNAIDMIFHQLFALSIDLNINIAKIVVEDDNMPLDFIGNDRVYLSETFTKARNYLSNNREIYPVDSFDHVFIFTSRPIVDGDLVIPASTQYVTDLYQDRKNGHLYNGVPITVMNYESNYAVAVHEISRSLGIKVDPLDTGLEIVGQCNSIMQNGGSKCNQCLKWTQQQKLQFISFIEHNHHRCFLLNKPRSIRPPGPSKFISAVKLCQCFDYDFYMPKGRREYIINSKQCHQPLECGKRVNGRLIIVNTLPPFDGSSCGKWNEKVCWTGVCTKIKPEVCERSQQLK